MNSIGSVERYEREKLLKGIKIQKNPRNLYGQTEKSED